jgi:hypothetical protein
VEIHLNQKREQGGAGDCIYGLSCKIAVCTNTMQNLVTPRPGTPRIMVYLAGRHGGVEGSLARALRSTYGRDIGRKGGAIFKRGGVPRACQYWLLTRQIISRQLPWRTFKHEYLLYSYILIYWTSEPDEPCIVSRACEHFEPRLLQCISAQSTPS